MSIPGILLGAYMIFVFVYFFWQWSRRLDEYEKDIARRAAKCKEQYGNWP